LAQTAGTAEMRLADAELLPFDFDDFTATIHRYITEVERLAATERTQITERNRAIDMGAYKAANDPRFPTEAPPKEAVPPFLNFAPLENALTALEHTAQAYDQALNHAAENGATALARAQLREANARLIAVERSLTSKDGLPNRPWYKNEIYAPGFYTGYGVKTLPAVRESIEQKEWKQADQAIVHVAGVLQNAGEAIQSAAAELSRATR
jgi:N-acetylated-alpha-linked acidic dipeptidase